MPNAVRARAATGNRSPGIIDTNAVKASGFHFVNVNSLRFDSNSDEHVEGPALSSVGTFTTKITVASWHKWAAADGGPTLFDSICGCSTNWSAANDGVQNFWASTTQARFGINSFSANVATSQAVTSTDWNFIVGVYDGTLGSANVKIYTNDAVLGGTTGNLTADITGQSNLVTVGKTWNTMDSGGTDDFTVGHTDEFAIWDTALTSAEISRLYNEGVAGFEYDTDSGDYVSANNLRLWWRLGDANDQDGADGILDQSGNGNHGTLTDITSANFDAEVAGGGV